MGLWDSLMSVLAPSSSGASQAEFEAAKARWAADTQSSGAGGAGLTSKVLVPARNAIEASNIRRLQKVLNLLAKTVGFRTLSVDGVIGQATHYAVNKTGWWFTAHNRSSQTSAEMAAAVPLLIRDRAGVWAADLSSQVGSVVASVVGSGGDSSLSNPTIQHETAPPPGALQPDMGGMGAGLFSTQIAGIPLSFLLIGAGALYFIKKGKGGKGRARSRGRKRRR